MNILEEIVVNKQAEVARLKEIKPVAVLEQAIATAAPVISLKEFLVKPGSSGIIAEFKRKSPSKGMINAQADAAETTQGYIHAGASALSVLTDHHFFGAEPQDLAAARSRNAVPVLRKDFIIDEYQVLESRAMGADAILLIAAILSKEKLSGLCTLAHSLGLEVLMEVHEQKELEKFSPEVDVIGVNNRNLKTFRTDIELSLKLLPYLPQHVLKISESGIDDPLVAAQLKHDGFDGFLIGEQFMKQEKPELACADFIQQFKKFTYAG